MSILQAGLNNSPDEFWYWLATALAACIVILLGWYLKRQEKTTDKLVDAVDKMGKMLAVHEQEIKDNKEDIQRIQDKLFRL